MKYLIILLALTSIGCATGAGHHITDSRGAWINIGRSPEINAYWCEAKEGQKPVCEAPVIKK